MPYIKEFEDHLEYPPVNDPPHMNVNLDPEWLAAHGFVFWTDEQVQAWKEAHPDPVIPRTTCTKYEMIRALRSNFTDLLAQLRQAYAAKADLQFYWNTVNELDRANSDFQTAVSALGITEAQLDAIFEVIRTQVIEAAEA